MSFSKNNLDKLKSILNNESTKHKLSNQKPTRSKKKHTKSSNNDDPGELFYSIINNSSTLEETTFTNPKLKNIEENLIKSKIDKYDHNNFSKLNKFNNELSEEELLYDEFNYLLEE